MTLGAPVRIRAWVSGVTGEALVTVQPVPVNQVVVTPGDSALVVGGTAQLTATALDAANAPLPGRSFLWQSSAPVIATVDTTGLVTGLAQGAVTITATAEGKSGTATVLVSPRPATRLAFAQQPGPSTAAVPLDPVIRIVLQDDLLTTVTGASNPVTIALAGNPGGATLGGTLTAAPVDGIATFANLTLDRAGTGYSFVATSPGLQPATSGSFSVAAGPAAQLMFTTAPPSVGQSGAPLVPQPVLQLLDGHGNVVQQAGVSVTATVASGGGSLSGAATVSTNSAGVATFGNLAVVGPTGSYALGMAAPGIATVTSGPIVLGAGAATALSMAIQPGSPAQSGIPFGRQPSLQLRDASNNPVAQAGVIVTAGIASGGGTLSGTLTASTNASGHASFTNLAISGTIGARRLSFSAPGLAGVSSTTINLTAGPAAGLIITTQPPSTAASGAVFAPQPVVQLRDAAGNAVSQAGVNLTAAITAGGQPALGGGGTVATNAGGAAVFTNLKITGVTGTRTLTFTSGSLAPAVSSAIGITAGTAGKLSITTQPSATATTGYAFAQQPVIQLRDAADNPVAQAGVVINAAVTSGAATIGGSLTATTNGGGVASFTNLALSGPAASYMLDFTSGGLTGIASTAIALGSDTLADNHFTPNAGTISTSEGAPYSDSDLWTGLEYSQSRFGYGPTKVVRLYICLSGRVQVDQCSLSPSPTGPLSASMLSDIEAGIASYTGTGIRLLLRFIYNFGPIGPGARDVPASLIVTHIDQLAPILLRQKDLIFALEAGFIGTWGEWHSSTSGNDNEVDRRTVLDRELFHFHDEFPIQVRYAAHLLAYSGTTTSSPQLGLHDDYFASSPLDQFTWAWRDGYSSQEQWDYALAVGATAMVVGEFAALYPPLQECNALDDFSLTFHLQSISLFIWPPEVATAIQGQGCLLSFLNKAGTRIEAQRVTVTGNPVPGGTLHVALTMSNTGYGRVIRARPAKVVLASGGSVVQQTAIPLSQMDLRLLASGATPVPRTFEFDVTLPGVLPSGSLTLSLLIPDPAPSLASQAAYALPLNSLDGGGQAVFNSATGRNRLATITPH